ncbi:MAG: phosphate uptake regulator PhoU [Candidatus Altiarchaeota archaeon]|nr:phosphate uptake regulator PhoU [Candidatus Altiarchaeota archaeon]
MDYRKIQLTGESTYIISLPKKWVERNELDRGDVLAIVDRGDDLVLKVKEEKETESTISIEKKSLELVSRMLITKYIQGFDTVTITSKDYIPLEIKKGLKDISALLIGMEEFGETSNEIVFRMLMREKGNVEDTVLRMHRMSLSSLKELLDNISEGDYNEHVLQSIIQRDNEIDKFYFLVLRQLSSLSSYDAVMWGNVAKKIERLSDHIENIARLVTEGGRIREEHIKEYRKLIEMYSSVSFALKNKSLKKAEEILEVVKDFRIKEKRMADSIKKTEPKTLLAYESLKRIGEYTSDIAEVAINMI